MKRPINLSVNVSTTIYLSTCPLNYLFTLYSLPTCEQTVFEGGDLSTDAPQTQRAHIPQHWREEEEREKKKGERRVFALFILRDKKKGTIIRWGCIISKNQCKNEEDKG